MHNKSSRDDNEVIGIFCFQYQHSTGKFFCSEVLTTPRSLSGFKANIIIAHAV